MNMIKQVNVLQPNQILSEELEDLQQQINRLQAKLENPPDYTRGVGDPRMASWELDRTLLQRLKRRIESIKHAQKSLKEGTYGLCESCGQPINPERLEILPDTKFCIACAQKKQ